MDDDQQFCLRWNNHQSTLISVFDTLLENETLVDCTLAAEGKFLKAHKVVLSACSPYFATLLQEQYDKHPIFILKDVKYQELRAMMDYMYRGEVNISQDQLAALLKAAESLQIKGLSDNRTGGGVPKHDQPQQQQHRGLGLAGSAVMGGGKHVAGGYTLEQTKRARLGPASIDSQELSGSREGSSSPTSRRRRKVRRRSIENAMTVHDNSNSSQIQPIATTSALLQQQSNANLGVGAITAAASALASQVPASVATALPTAGAASTIAANASNLSGTTQQQQLTAATTSVTKKTEGVKGSSGGIVAAGDGMHSDLLANIDEQQQQHAGAGLELKSEKQNHKQKSVLAKEAAAAAAAGGSAGTELVIEPKSEYDDEGNDENVEDLTLDDEDMGMEDLDHNAGTSHGNEGSSQGYAQWQHDRSQDEVYMGTQEAQQRDPQGTPEGYWTILETVPYSLHSAGNAANTTTTTISSANTQAQQHLQQQLQTQQHQQQQAQHHQLQQQQHVAASDAANLIATATVVVEIPSDAVGIAGSTIQYTIPKSDHHQLLRNAAAVNKQQQQSHHQQQQNTTIQIVKDTRQALQHHQQQQLHHQQSQQQQLQQISLQQCIEATNSVVQQAQTQTHESEQHEEFIKLNTSRMEDKLLLRSMMQYETTSVTTATLTDAATGAAVSSVTDEDDEDDDVADELHMCNSKTQVHHIQQQQHQQLQQQQPREILLEDPLKVVNEAVEGATEELDELEEEKLNSTMLTTLSTPTQRRFKGENNLQLQYVCNVCGKAYKIKGSLKRHKSYECGVTPGLSCPHCPHKSKYKSDLRKHMSQKHGAGSSSSDQYMST